ncbi:hypothetical protein Cgig2_006316 [Carnegiea gigantea]|uniref:Uncharacterized protein n=1 Tax=Carnegiea gigantea TaxID=171969 RepID=A0A9Q1GRT0_9CARY|nr:hypothetical protein Cgig2_006316 [Carnegiea gigantea]
MDGNCGSQRVPLENGDESSHDPIYRRSFSLKTLTVSPPPYSKITWIRKEKVQKGTLSYSYNDQKSCINVCKGYANFFDAMVIEKVNTEFNGDEKFLFLRDAIEWTEYIFKHFEHTLRSAGIYGVVGVSNYPYHFDRDVWRAFCEFWGPLTNTLHHGAGEVGISLYNLERIDGLPILGDPCPLELVAESFLQRRINMGCFWKRVGTGDIIWPSMSLAKGYPNIYHGLGQVASHPDHSSQANPCFPIHYVVGRLAEVFPALYSQRPDSECPIDYPTLMLYTRMSAKRFTLAQASSILETSNLSLFAFVDMISGKDPTQALLANKKKHSIQLRFLQNGRISGYPMAPSFSFSRLCLYKEILKEEEQLHKIQEDLLNQKQKLITIEEELRASLYFKRKEKERLQVELAEAGFTKLQDLEKEKHQLNILVDSIVSFNKY